ncbi:MAG: autotransporter outer membrane beta-barrel domain-containing protein [Sutterella sp.]|nr:autotransporter outer membrane beta-barrel domain-containing protein [Sutterella sp.]
MRERLIASQRSRSSLKRFALSLLTSATLLAVASPSFAFSYAYEDRYAGLTTVENNWETIQIINSSPTNFTGDHLIGYHGHSTGVTNRMTAFYFATGDSIDDTGHLTLQGTRLRIVERPDGFNQYPLNTIGLLLYEGLVRPGGTYFKIDTELDIDLQNYVDPKAEKGHGALIFESAKYDTLFNITTFKPVQVLFYSNAPYYKSGSINTYVQGIRNRGSVHYTAKDTVDMKLVMTEKNLAYGINVEGVTLKAGDANYRFEKDTHLYLQAQKGGTLYGVRLAGFNRLDQTDATGKAVLSNVEGSTFFVDIETKNSELNTTKAYGLYLTANSALDLKGKAKLTFWEDPAGKSSNAYYGVYANLEENGYTQFYDFKVNELTVVANAPKVSNLYGTHLYNSAGVATSATFNTVDYQLTTQAQNPVGLYLGTVSPGSQQTAQVTDTFKVETTSAAAAYPVFLESAAGGSTQVNLKDVTLTLNSPFEYAIYTVAQEENSKTELTIAGTLSATLPQVQNNSAFFYASAIGGAQSAIHFTGGGTLTMSQGALMESAGEHALIEIAPTQATEWTGFGLAHTQGKLAIHLTRPDQRLQMSLLGQRDTGGVVDVTLDNESQWLNVGALSTIDTLTLNTGGRVDLRQGTGKDAQGTLGQAFLTTRALQGTGGTIALDVNTETNLGQILVIEERSEGSHQLQIGNRASAVATGVPIKVVESVGGETSDAFKATFKEETPVEVGELKYYVVKTNDAKAMYATLTGATTDESAEHSSDNASEHASDQADPAADSTDDATPSPNARRRVARAATEPVAEETSTEPAIVTDVAADTNPNNWYLAPRRVAPEPEPTPDPDPTPEPTPEPQPAPLPDFTDTAKGVVSTASVQYLAAMLPLETLRERLGDIHTFKPLDNKATPWVKLSGTEWRVKPTLTQDTWDVNFAHAKVGVDTRVGDKSLVGGYLAYSRFDTQHPAPAFVKGTGFEGGLYWTYLSENRTFSDLVLRLGRVEAKFDTTDTRGMSVKARDIDNTYWGLTWNVGRQVPLTQSVVIEPMALVGYTRFGSTRSVSSSGLTGDTRGYDSLLTMLGSTVEGRFTTSSGKPWTLYGKLFWEKEWLANTDIVFNGHNTYRTDFKDHRWVYGFGIEGMLGKTSTWHVDVERSTGSALRENWQVNAGLRIPF